MKAGIKGGAKRSKFFGAGESEAVKVILFFSHHFRAIAGQLMYSRQGNGNQTLTEERRRE